MIARPADEPGSCDEEAVAHSGRRRLLAGDLRLAVQLAVDLVPVGRGEQGRGLVRPQRGVGGVGVAGRDIHPVPGLAAQHVERSTNEARLPRHLNDRVPYPVEQGLVRRRDRAGRRPPASLRPRLLRSCHAQGRSPDGRVRPPAATAPEPPKPFRPEPGSPYRHTSTGSPPGQADSLTADGQPSDRSQPSGYDVGPPRHPHTRSRGRTGVLGPVFKAACGPASACGPVPSRKRPVRPHCR